MLADIVGLKIRKTVGPGNCIADGWSCAGIHYFGIIHRWPVLNPSGDIVIKQALLSCQPLVNEERMDAESHAESIQDAYAMYGDFDELVVCFTLDNCSTNSKSTKLLGKPMIGAYCHRLNLAVRHFINDAFDGRLLKHLEMINAVMLRASTLKGRAKLKDFTKYVPKKQNKTRWTGYHDMEIKYVKIHAALSATGMFADLCEEDKEVIDINGKDGTKKVLPTLLRREEFDEFKDIMLPSLK